MYIGVKAHVYWHEWHVMLWHSPVVFFVGQALSPAWDKEMQAGAQALQFRSLATQSRTLKQGRNFVPSACVTIA